MTMVKLKIAKLRKLKGVGQQELAEVLGVSSCTDYMIILEIMI